MDYQYLADLLYPNPKYTVEEIEKMYPPRNLPDGAKVTRFAPSPTGFVHFGSLLPTRVCERLAHQSGGVFFLRIEDTDNKRKVEGAVENLINTYDYFKINFDEGAGIDKETGDYGPYRQSDRGDIYQAFAKKLISEGKAYPCFCTAEELDKIRAEQEAINADPGYYGKWAIYRDADIETVKAKLSEGLPYVIRFRSEGNINNKIKFTDLVKGNIEITENAMDHVLLKSDGIPTYHFAHAIDDHFMGTTHVVRGEEWLPSLPFHIQLFSALGFKLPKFLHISQLMKLENGNKKKLSKRDKEASVSDYRVNGYAPECITEYVMTLLNSNYEEWRQANPDKSYEEFPFSIKKMSASGSLFDADKLIDICKNTVSRMSADEVYDKLTSWAKDYDTEFYPLLTANPEYTKAILSIGRGGKKPRKDIAIWSEAKDYMGFFYDEIFAPDYSSLSAYDKEDVKKVFESYKDIYSAEDAQDVWFNKIKELTASLGYAADMKEYKANPDSFKGNVGDVSGMLRIAVTGKTMSPDMFAVMSILGKDRVIKRLDKALNEI